MRGWVVESGATRADRQDAGRRLVEHFEDVDAAAGCMDGHAKAGRSVAMMSAATFDADSERGPQ